MIRGGGGVGKWNTSDYDFSLEFEVTYGGLESGVCYVIRVRVFSLGDKPEVDEHEMEQGTQVTAPSQTPLARNVHFEIGNDPGSVFKFYLWIISTKFFFWNKFGTHNLVLNNCIHDVTKIWPNLGVYLIY